MIDDLKLARRSCGLTQRALGERIGVDTQTIKRLETKVGSVATLVAAMKVLDFHLTGLAPGATFAERLRAQRLKRGLSITRVVKRSKLSRNTIVGLEAGGGSVGSLLRLLQVIAPTARRRAPERVYWGEGDKIDRDSWFTPPEFMTNIYEAFGSIDLDPCGHKLSLVRSERRFLLAEGDDGFVDDWSGRLAFVNPPYSRVLDWLKRAHEQWQAGNVDTVFCLVPVRTDSAWFHTTLKPDANVYLLQGRVKFGSPDGKAQHTPFALMAVMLGASAEQKESYAERVAGSWMA